MRSLLLVLLLLGPAFAQEGPGPIDPINQVRDESPEDLGAAVVPGGIQRERVTLESSPYARKLFSADLGRTYAQITNKTTTSEVICVNGGFPSNQVSLGKILYLESIGWYDLAATFDIYCTSKSAVELELAEYIPQLPADPEIDDEVATFIMEPTPVPSPDMEEGFPSGAPQPGGPVTNIPIPAYPNPSATPTPTPVLAAGNNPADETLTDPGTPTPTPTPVALEEN